MEAKLALDGRVSCLHLRQFTRKAFEHGGVETNDAVQAADVLLYGGRMGYSISRGGSVALLS